MKKIILPLAAALCAGAQPQGAPWREMPQGSTGAVFSNASQTNGTVIVNATHTGGSHWGYWLFDLSPNSQKWLSTTGNNGWAVYQFANGDCWAVTNYTLWSTDSPGRDPRVWQLEGSNNLEEKILLHGANAAAVNAAQWTAVDARSNSGALGGTGGWNVSQTFSCAGNETAYNAYRLNVSQFNGGDVGVALGEWMMRGHSGAARLWQHAPEDVGNFSATLHGWFDTHVDRGFTFYVLNATEDWAGDLARWRAYGFATQVPAPPTNQVFSIAFHGLVPRTNNYVRLLAVSGAAEAWSECVMIPAFDDNAPAVVSLPAEDLSENGATASGKLLYAPGGSADIRLLWGKQNGVWEHEEFVGGASDGGAFTWPLGGLDSDTAYYYLFTASNAAAFAASPASVSFTTRGGAFFGGVGASVFSNAARLRAELVDAGWSPVVVSLWFGAENAALDCVAAWDPTTNPGFYDLLLDPLDAGATYCFAFMASNTTNGAQVWTAPHSFKVANATLAWDGSQNNLWDTLSGNWHPSHVTTPLGGSLFSQGDGAVFGMAGASAALAADVDAERVSITQGLALENGRDLWILRALSVNNNAAAVLDGPRLTGPGGVLLENATLRLGNPANDFEGGVRVSHGTLNAVLPGANGNLLGAGGVTLGQETHALFAATLNVTGAATNTTAGALAANGVFNSGRVNIAENTSARFGALRQAAPGATLTLNPGAGGALLVDEPPGGGVFPPWFAFAGGNGDYAARGADGTLSRADAAARAGAGIATLSGVLDASTNAASVMVSGDLDLAGQTLALDGSGGAAGLLLRGSVADGAGGGGLDLCGNDLYVYNEGATRIFAVPAANPGNGLYQFGNAVVSYQTGALPPFIIAQETAVEFGGAADFEYAGRVWARGNLAKTGAGHATLRGAGGELFTGQALDLNGGRLTLADGVSNFRWVFSIGAGTRLDVTNASLSVIHAANLNQLNAGASMNILAGGLATLHNNSLAVNGGRLVVADGARMELLMNQWIELRAPDNAFVCATNKGHLAVANRFTHTSGSRHAVCFHDAAFQCNSLGLGAGAAAHNTTLDIHENGRVTANLAGIGQVFTDTGPIISGPGGSNNTLRVHVGGAFAANTITVGNNVNLPLGNTLLLAGGGVAATTLNVCTNGVLAVEIQENGLPGACVLTGAAHFAGGSILRASAVPGVPTGEWLVLTAAGGIHGGEYIQFQPPVPGGGWSMRVDGNELRVKFSKPGTLLMVR